MALSLLQVGEAKERISAAHKPISETENLNLNQLLGRIISRDILSRVTQPPFDASAMDGYAIHERDCGKEGISLEVIGEVSAGQVAGQTITAGQALRIFTGAPVPDGASAVIIQENTEQIDGRHIRITSAASEGANIRRSGQDFSNGQPLLKAGTQLNARSLSLAAAAGHGTLDVYRRPRIAILATGNELVPLGTLPGPGQISASGGIAIAALAQENGAEIIDLGIARDTRAEIQDSVKRAIAEKADVLLTIGGASVGDHDLIRPVLGGMGMELDFWKVAMRPGKPLMVGRLGEMLVLGLPGNPVSSFVCALLFAEPLLRKLGHLPPRNREASVLLEESMPTNGPRQHFMRGVFTDVSQTSVRALSSQDSSLLQALTQADCLIVRPSYASEAKAGDSVQIIRLA
ncbi:molybdopterin molybdochelatase [Martelella mediterranea]|uniref:Molybdopterin molybdenumtransferase n=1 Tax=Martelella mediterranea TaxID=293089 RepID=A0A4R3NTQ2_9HYPH|nr:molybdopterin molybdochelatase [Martelella mediterranea]